MNKRFFCISLALVLALTLAACGGSGTAALSAGGGSLSTPPGGDNSSAAPQGSTAGSSTTGGITEDLSAPEIPYVLPENLKLTYKIDGMDTRTVIKIGNDYHSAYRQNGTDPIAGNSFFFRHNSDGTWTQYSYNSGWQAGTKAWADPADGVGGLESSNFYWRILLDAKDIYLYGDPVETATIVSRPVEKYNGWGGGSFCVDTETGLVLQGDDGNVAWEVIEWDETVADFGDIEIPG